jgi:hypothetical protein
MISVLVESESDFRAWDSIGVGSGRGHGRHFELMSCLLWY